MDTIDTKKKLKKLESTWELVSGSFRLDGEDLGPLDWSGSRYMRKGGQSRFYAYVSGSLYVVAEENRVGYVAPKQYTWGVPEQVGDGED